MNEERVAKHAWMGEEYKKGNRTKEKKRGKNRKNQWKST